ncbi:MULTISPECIES: imidazole glycerol phosphate synthase subunit HisH [unclassified Flavobacterium]|uniref:imidazole glycerol phosphate synthase subunit HisH n=1 Tax=unclassified Flavobacterium TaxID=196869 RepID=UPI00095CEC98|nr:MULTISPECIES: imidazole glycerol phosphate synthase subunit HisH [unclassified Flavobacterium]MBN9284519.1 imidazole glycerol phosphate synthase subunit HisH [Flavobacterium sp.]OJV72814.1 MAG: imidazole glycerol phosphate synthase, glutamine amidotransferase subunit [Flavobacterium sp. 40-81]
MKIAIIDYGSGNIQSVQFALQRLGHNGILSADPEVIATADKVLFPGVGEASSAMNRLQKTQLDLLIPQLRQPVLGICLGMHLLSKTSEEGNTACLDIFDTAVVRFPNTVKVPQVGWNTLYNLRSELFKGIPEQEFMYLVHSYYAPLSKECIAAADYGICYSAALQRDNFFGVQFHPEKSGLMGEKLLSNFLKL